MSNPARLTVFILLVAGIWSLEHLYVGWRLLSLPWLAGGWSRRAALVVLVAGFLAYPLGRVLWHSLRVPLAPTLEWLGAAWMGTLFLLLVFLLLADVVTLGGLVGRSVTVAVRSGAVVVALAASILALYGGVHRPRVQRVEVELDGLPPALDGVRLLELSDLHLGTLSGRRFLASMIRLTRELDPDVVTVTGDLFDSEAETVEELLPELREFRAPMGMYAVLGNHEFYAGAARCTALMEAAGMVVLHNEAREVAPGLWVAGVPDRRGAAQTGGAGDDLEGAVAGVPAGAALVLLQHAPEREQAAEALGVGLMLSGHTHGGQIWPFHLLVRRAYPHLAGVYRVGRMTGIVSRGAGRWGPPMRLLAPADVVLVTLRQPRGSGSSAPPDTGRSTPVR